LSITGRWVLAFVLIGASSAARAAETSLHMTNDPASPGGEGQEFSYTTADGTFFATESYENGAAVRFAGVTSDFWSLDFGAPVGEPLVPATYRGAQRFPFQDPGRPGLSVYGSGAGGCNTLTGEFRIKEISYASPGVVGSLWAVFEQHCEGDGPALRGDLRFNADVVVAVSAPLTQTVERMHPLSIEVSATDVLGRAVALSTQGLPDGATFTDHGDGTGTLSWTPGFGQIGSHEVTVVGDNGEGGTDTATTTIEVKGTTSLLLDSEPGAIGGGALHWYTPADGTFRARPNFGNGASLSFATPTYSHFWNLDFAAAGNAPLTVGTYLGATRFPFQVPGTPGLAVFGDGAGCNTLTGSFEVKQIEIVDGTPSAFWATFVQRCDFAAGTLRGEIRFNANVPILLNAPANVSAPENQETTFEVSADDDVEGPIELDVTGLPSGATFTDRGDGTGTFRWTPASSQLGVHAMGFTASNEAGDTDTFPTRVTVRVRNDDFDAAVRIPSLPFVDVRDTTTATGSPDDPFCGGNDVSVWYVFTPESDVYVILDTAGSNYSATFGVYTGTRGNLDQILCANNGGAKTFHAIAGETYHIKVSGTFAGGSLHFSASEAPAPPVNDDFDHATVVSSLPFSETIDVSSATTADDDPYSYCGSHVRTVWYAVTPDRDGAIVVDTDGSDYLATVAAFTGSRGSLDQVLCGYQSIHVPVSAGVTYDLVVEDLTGNASASLTLSLTLIAPLGIGATVEPASAVDLKTGVAYVSGTVGCTRPAPVVIQGTATQGAVQGTIDISMYCTGVTRWSAPVVGAGGRFRLGLASVALHAVADDGELGGTAETYVQDTTVLKVGRIRGAPPAEPLRVVP
jgi:hypothetical protein